MQKILIAILVAIAIVVVFLPQILSSSFGKPFFERALGKKFNVKATIQSVHLSWFGPQALDGIEFSNPEMSGSIESLQANVPLWRLSEFGNAFELKGGSASFSRYGNLSIGPVNAMVKGQDVEATGKASQGGTFSINGKIYSKTDFDIAANFSGMPSAPFDQLLKANGILSGSLGPSFDLTSSALYNQGAGHLEADLTSPNAKASLKGQIAEDSLLLKEPFTATLNFSPSLSQAIGGRVLEAKNPITLRIETTGTSIPLKPFNLQQVEIGQATLNLGQLVCTGLHPLISLFALLNQTPIASSTAVVWFTPVEFSCSKGILHMGRIDALIANSVHLAAWGDVQLATGRLDMTLGLPADTLEQTLGIKNLARNSVLQIPVSGTVQDPKFESGSAAAKIAAMVAGQQISKKAGVFGLFNQIPLSKEEKKAPPANRPFPWEK
jgi:hypothetical protein